MEDIVNTVCNEKDPKKMISFIKKLKSTIVSFIYYLCTQSDTKQSIFIKSCIQNYYLTPFKGTMTLTFGDVAESHVGMQKIGKMAKNGFQLTDLEKAISFFQKKGYKTILIKLNDYLPDKVDESEEPFLEKAKTDKEYEAYVLIVRNGLDCLLTNGTKDDLTTELLLYDWDTKLYNDKKDKVQNKNARHNLNFDKDSQTSDFTKGKGTTVAWKDVPFVNQIRKNLVTIFGENAKGLKCEGNKYYEPKGTGIGYHGDTERRKVIGVRLGRTMNLHYMWYFNDRPRGYNVSFQLHPGDIYCMSEKTVGTDWRPNIEKGWQKKRYTLRHAAGAPEYTTETAKIKVKMNNKSKYPDITLGDIYYKRKAGIKEKQSGTKTEWEKM
jgi:alkylated DNA repair dioxygenase AlkB